MKFKLAPTDENYPLLRMVSEGGKWELGFSPVLFGVRVRLGLVNDIGPTIDYCAGASEEMRSQLLIWILQIMLPLDENSLTQREVSAMFPNYTVRPMEKDTVCLDKLQTLVKNANALTTDKEIKS